MTPDAPERRRAWARALVAVSGVLTGLGYGLNYGAANQNTYLLRALRNVDPTVLTHDWQSLHTQDYHPAFTALATGLLYLDRSGWLIALLNVAAIAAGAVAIYLILCEISGEDVALPAYLLVASIVMIGATYSVSGSYLYSLTFQPSTIPAIAYLYAILCFVRERYLASGVILAVGNLFHANYLVLSFPLFGLAHLGLGVRGLPSRLIRQLAPSLIPLAVLFPLFWGQTQSTQAVYARDVFLRRYAPQHYYPPAFWSEFVVFYSWVALGVLAGWKAVQRSRASIALGLIALSTLVLVSLASLLTTAVFVPVISQLYVWRLAPYTVLLAQVFAASGYVQALAGRHRFDRLGPRLALVTACAIPIWFTFRYHYGPYRNLQYAVLIGLAVVFLITPRSRSDGPNRRLRYAGFIAVGVWLLAGLAPLKDTAARSSLIRGIPVDERALYAWVRTTPPESVFLTPPLLRFRFHGQRAVVVDMQSAPFHPDQFVAWYRRVELVTGTPGVVFGEGTHQGYARLDSTRIERIRQAHPFDYVVVRAEQDFAGSEQLELVFENDSFRVYGWRPPNRPGI